MLDPFRRTSIASVAALVAVVAAGCGQPAPALPPTAQALPGRQHYEAFKCWDCHGKDLAGTDKGPTLRATASHWSVDELVQFLAHPDSARRSDARLGQLADAYAPIAMPGYNIPRPPLHELAQYLIEATR